MPVSPVNLKALAYVLDVEGFDGFAALQRCSLAPHDALDDGVWLPDTVLDQLMAATLDLTGDPCFGLVAGKSKGLMRYVTLIQVTLVAPTLRHVVDAIHRYAPLYLDRSELTLVETAGRAFLLVEPVVAAGATGRFRTDLVAMSAFQAIGFAGGTAEDILGIEFPYDCPPELAERYLASFGPSVRFGRRRCAVEFDPRLLDRPLKTHDAVAYAAARANAEAALSARRAGVDIAQRVRAWLLAALPHQPSMQETAAHLHLTERALRRSLAAMDTSHGELVQQCQRTSAEHLMADPALPIKQVADRLGFASVSSFHRAFRRWTDLTPQAWRAAGVAERLDRAGENPVTPGQ